jgi:hypothetical protein
VWLWDTFPSAQICDKTYSVPPEIFSALIIALKKVKFNSFEEISRNLKEYGKMKN